MNIKRNTLYILAILLIGFLPAIPMEQHLQETQAQSVGCTSGAPGSGAYTVTLCITSPTDGSTLSGDVTTTATITVTGTNPGVQRMVFYLNGTYLLTDYQSSYTFLLPTTHWVDGSYTLSVSALMRDAFTTPQASVSINFNNGISFAAGEYEPVPAFPRYTTGQRRAVCRGG